eukprot:2868008-Amphidinium_carterae.1
MCVFPIKWSSFPSFSYFALLDMTELNRQREEETSSSSLAQPGPERVKLQHSKCNAACQGSIA